jgi:hypothetical protein
MNHLHSSKESGRVVVVINVDMGTYNILRALGFGVLSLCWFLSLALLAHGAVKLLAAGLRP